MHLSPQTLSAVGDSLWMIPGPMLLTPGLGLGLTFSFNANMTVSVQYTYDDPQQNPRQVTINRAGTVATITDNGHNLNVGDSVLISQDSSGTFGSPPVQPGSAVLPAISYDIATVVDANNYTITVPNSGSVGPVTAALQSFRVFTHPTLQNISGNPPAKVDGNFAFQIAAFRLKCTVYAAGTATLTAQQGKGY